ncbi:MAG: hypothetical protein HYZ71_05340 [Deltaproteobacteria bacterium]|nr:hypothetical protein [Deltaproteobacteria bacterium]
MDTKLNRMNEEQVSLLDQVTADQPFAGGDSAESVAQFKAELASLALSLGVTADQLLRTAETSSDYREEYSKALMLSRRIARFSK